MGVKITDLPSASNSNNSDLLAIVQNGETKNVQKSVLVDSVNNNIAIEYSPASTYSAGDYCIYQGQLYRCTQTISTPEEFNSGHWEIVDLASSSNIMKNSADINANNNNTVGIYRVPNDNNCTNYPVTSGNGILLVFKPKENVIYQIFSTFSGTSWGRVCWYGSWNGWRIITNDIYSTNETVCGVWEDGRTVYKKVIKISSTALSVGDNTINVSIPGLDMVIDHYLTKHNSGGYVLPWQSSNGKLTYVSQIKSDKIVITAGEGWSSSTWIIIIKYVKSS